MKFQTKLVRAGEPRPLIEGAVSMPVFQTSTYQYRGETGYHDQGYARLSNTPNHVVLHEKIASLEGGEAALVTASGMAAISAALLTVLQAGDHVLAQECLYGGTHSLITNDLARLGITHTFVDADAPDTWQAAVRPNTKAIYVETISNPLIGVGDLPAVAAFAKRNGLTSLIDNTFASPVNFRPIEVGFDVVLHSCTKYMNGHSDLTAGAVIGAAETVERVRHKLNHLGGSLDPHACFLLHRGLKTLALRMRYQNQSALGIARFLEAHDAVSRVNYAGLESHPQHQRARDLFDGFGGTMSFELKAGASAAERLIGEVTLPIHAVSVGGIETLITQPALTAHAGIAPRELDALGINDGLIRLSVGIEDTEDLIEDFRQALATIERSQQTKVCSHGGA